MNSGWMKSITVGLLRRTWISGKLFPDMRARYCDNLLYYVYNTLTIQQKSVVLLVGLNISPQRSV